MGIFIVRKLFFLDTLDTKKELKNTVVTYTEDGKTKTTKTNEDGRIILEGCIDTSTVFTVPGFCESEKLEDISDNMVHMTKFTCKYNERTLCYTYRILANTFSSCIYGGERKG